MNKKLLFTLLIAALVISGLTFQGALGEEKGVGLSDQDPISFSSGSDERPMAPDFELQTIDGKILRLSEYRGKAVLLNFWATWCGPCRVEIPDFIELMENKDRDKFVIIGLTLQSGTPEQIKQFAARQGMNYPVVYGDDSTMMRLAEMYGGVRGIPTTFLIGPEGKVHKRYVGPRSGEVFWNDIQSVL